MTGPAIDARGLGKRYFIQTRTERSTFRSLRRWVSGESVSPLWAVRGLDLRVERGECVGLIGANGSGKTTLLMLLAGLMAPTEGSLEVRGSVSPFFRIGSGLFSELSVLDNLKLAAALFGFSRKALTSRLDAIIAFAELEPYLFARLGTLSSGYQSRVAFSVALHADIDLMLIDEVFSVGDMAFSRRCVERMERLRAGGATVVLASHDLELVSTSCSRALWLSGGLVRSAGPAAEVAQSYRRASAPAVDARK